EDDVIADFDMPGQGGVVGKHAVAAHHAVMCDVGIGQQPVAVADPGAAATAAGAPVERDELADGVAGTDHQLDPFARVLLVLGLAADGGVPDETVARPDPGRPVDGAVRPELAAVTDLHVLADVAERPHAHAPAEPGARLDDG